MSDDQRRQLRARDEDLNRAIDRLSRVAQDMAVNGVEAQRAGLEGDARRWRTVRADVVAALELLGAPDDVVGLGWATITVDVSPDNLAAEQVQAPEAVLVASGVPLLAGQSVWVSDGAGRKWEGMLRRRATDDPDWQVRLLLGRTYDDATGDAVTDDSGSET